MNDFDTNFVYISRLLRSDFKPFCDELTGLFGKLGIAWDFLDGTRDIWVRDFMPVQLSKDSFWGYKYSPDYLLGKEQYISDQSKIAKNINLELDISDIVFDGGNIVFAGEYALVCDKVFAENSRSKNDKEFIARLEKELGKKLILLPWRAHPSDKNGDIYGHSDGFVKYCGKNKILMSSHADSYPSEAQDIKLILEFHGFSVEQMSFAKPCYEYDWAYINFLQIGSHIIMPSFGSANDEIAKEFIARAFVGAKISSINCQKIASLGGALHCIAWNIFKKSNATNDKFMSA